MDERQTWSIVHCSLDFGDSGSMNCAKHKWSAKWTTQSARQSTPRLTMQNLCANLRRTTLTFDRWTASKWCMEDTATSYCTCCTFTYITVTCFGIGYEPICLSITCEWWWLYCSTCCKLIVWSHQQYCDYDRNCMSTVCSLQLSLFHKVWWWHWHSFFCHWPHAHFESVSSHPSSLIFL